MEIRVKNKIKLGLSTFWTCWNIVVFVFFSFFLNASFLLQSNMRSVRLSGGSDFQGITTHCTGHNMVLCYFADRELIKKIVSRGKRQSHSNISWKYLLNTSNTHPCTYISIKQKQKWQHPKAAKLFDIDKKNYGKQKAENRRTKYL